jgi:hypothetical protein
VTHNELVAKQIFDIIRRPHIRALNELAPEFSEDDMQAIDAPRLLPAATFADAIDMRKAMVIQGRGGDHANK